MKKTLYLTLALASVFNTTSYSKPMESIENYNVILVHGAGDYKDSHLGIGYGV